MKHEQMELMKVIEFPKDKIKEKLKNERIGKLDAACKMLKYLIEEEADFHIVLKIETANKLFEVSEEEMKKYDYIILTSNYEESKHIPIKRSCVYRIKGDEFE